MGYTGMHTGWWMVGKAFAFVVGVYLASLIFWFTKHQVEDCWDKCKKKKKK